MQRRNIRIRICIILTILAEGCGAPSKVDTAYKVAEKFKDVFILSTLIRDHLRNTHDRGLNLDELIQNDSLRRISNSFQEIELISRGGHLAIHYKFSNSRDIDQIKLVDKEVEMINNVRWIENELNDPYDGEIQFDYGERGYRIRKIVIRK